jgi:hypothetical protein
MQLVAAIVTIDVKERMSPHAELIQLYFVHRFLFPLFNKYRPNLEIDAGTDALAHERVSPVCRETLAVRDYCSGLRIARRNSRNSPDTEYIIHIHYQAVPFQTFRSLFEGRSPFCAKSVSTCETCVRQGLHCKIQ